MIYHYPPAKEIAKEEYYKAPSFLKMCWICHSQKGRHLYAIQLPIAETWAIRIACDRCTKKLRNTVYWYN